MPPERYPNLEKKTNKENNEHDKERKRTESNFQQFSLAFKIITEVFVLKRRPSHKDDSLRRR